MKTTFTDLFELYKELFERLLKAEKERTDELNWYLETNHDDSGIYLFGFVVLYHNANFSYDEASKMTNFLLFLLGVSGLLNIKY